MGRGWICEWACSKDSSLEEILATISEIAKQLEVSNETIKSWTTEFSEHFSSSANAKKNQPRQYGEKDMRILLLISEHWDDDPDLEHIHFLLNSNEYEGGPYAGTSRLNTPIFQQVPEEIDESWQHGCVISGMAFRDWHHLARSYKLAGDKLVDQVLSRNNEPQDFDYPILFLYRHSIELYLKTILNESNQSPSQKGGHDIDSLITLLEEQDGKSMFEWIRDRLLDFHRIDLKSDVFRYPEEIDGNERWIDFHQLRTVMNRLVEVFDDYLFKR